MAFMFDPADDAVTLHDQQLRRLPANFILTARFRNGLECTVYTSA